jgi:hypothetical protein
MNTWTKCQWCKRRNAVTTEEAEWIALQLETSTTGRSGRWPYDGSIVCDECTRAHEDAELKRNSVPWVEVDRETAIGHETRLSFSIRVF